MTVYVAVIFGYFTALVVLQTALLLLAALEVNRYRARRVPSDLRHLVRSPLAPSISLVVPAFNEEIGIVDSVSALLAIEYPSFEIVVVNDGSSDGTLDRLIEAFDLREGTRPTPPFLAHEPVRASFVPRGSLPLLVVDKENGGKSDALNAGINFAANPLVCCIDADSILEQDALAKAASPFVEDPDRTIAAAGIVRVANGCRIDRGRVLAVALPRRPLELFQVVEYLRAFFATRAGWSAINGLVIVSGAFGLFRRDAVIDAGGFSTDTVGEDVELIVRLHRTMRSERRPYRIVFVPDPMCWTESPATASGLRKQRARWHRGSAETLIAHRRMVGNPRYRAVGLLALPALLIFEVLGPAVELSGYGVATAGWVTHSISPTFFVLFLAVALVYGLFPSLVAIAVEDLSSGRHQRWRDLAALLTAAVFENFGYRQLCHFWRLEGFWQLLRRTTWAPTQRRGFSTPAIGAPLPVERRAP